MSVRTSFSCGRSCSTRRSSAAICASELAGFWLRRRMRRSLDSIWPLDGARPGFGLLRERAQLGLGRGTAVEHLAEPSDQGEVERLGHRGRAKPFRWAGRRRLQRRWTMTSGPERSVSAFSASARLRDAASQRSSCAWCASASPRSTPAGARPGPRAPCARGARARAAPILLVHVFTLSRDHSMRSDRPRRANLRWICCRA